MAKTQSKPRTKPQPAPQQAPVPVPLPMPVAQAAASAVQPAGLISAQPITFSPSVPLDDSVSRADIVADRGTASTSAAPSPTQAGGGKSPALVVSEKVVDLGEARWNGRLPARKIKLMNAGGGEMKGTVQATQPWVALNVQSFTGNAQTVEIRVKQRQLPLGRVELRVPNLFAIIWARTRWALPFIGFWLWVLLLVASSLGRWMLWGLVGLVGVVLLAEVLMWWWAFHVRLLVPAERVNQGRLLVKSSGGEQQIEVKVKARPSPFRKALGWTLAAIFIFAELGAVIWIVLAIAGYPVTIPGLM